MKYPKITIIVPAYNEEKYISQCLDSLVEQSYEGETEIIIADAQSQDNTRQIIEQFQEKYHKIILIDNPAGHQGPGRNLAIERSDSDLIAYIDAHSYATKDWLKNLYESYIELKNKDDRLVGIGSIHLDAGQTPFTIATTAAYNSFFGGSLVTSYSDRKELRKVDTAFACLYDKKIIQQVGCYNSDFIKGEDLELNLRLTQKNNFNLYINPKAVTYYYKREDSTGLLEQMYSYGYWRYRVMKHLGLYKPALFLPSIFIMMQILLALLSLIYPPLLILFLLFILFYFGVLIVSAFYYSIKSKCSFLLLTYIYPCIHFGYGFGFLAAMLKSNYSKDK